MVQTKQETEGTTLPPNGVFALFFEDQMTKDLWLFWRGGWKLRCEFLGSLKYFLHGLVERVGEKQSGNYPSSKWCFCLVF